MSKLLVASAIFIGAIGTFASTASADVDINFGTCHGNLGSTDPSLHHYQAPGQTDVFPLVRVNGVDRGNTPGTGNAGCSV